MGHFISPAISQNRLVKQLESRGIHNPAVLAAFLSIPRHHFLDQGLWHKAYEDITLPIGKGQTISQPYIVALMTQLLDLYQSDLKVLEIGTGSGFQTAILSRFTRRLFTVERFRDLSFRAREKLKDLQIVNVAYKVGDGSEGWIEHGPFDRIIVTAGAPVVPQALLKQLAPEGKLLIPTGDRQGQHLELYHRRENCIERSLYDDVLFVPLVGKNGWTE